MQDMDWNALKVLITISQCGSLKAAARSLGVNYTTVLRRIETLEQQVGGKLFERGAKGYVATQLADEILALTKPMQQSVEHIERQLIGRELQPKGLVKITAPFNIANRYLPPILKTISNLYPDITFEVLSSNDIFNLNSRVADIAIRATTAPPEHLIGRKAVSIPWSIFAARSLVDKYTGSINIDTLTACPLIGASGHLQELSGFSWLESHCHQAIVTRCDELTAMSYCAEQGLGIAFLPQDQRRAGLIEVAEFSPGNTSDLWILMHPDLRRTERLRIVYDHLYHAFREISF